MRPGLFRSWQRTVSLKACREFARHRLRNLIGSCGRYGSIVSAKHYPGFCLACCELRSKTHLSVNAFRNSGSRSGDSLRRECGAVAVAGSGQPRSRMADSLAIWLSFLSALAIWRQPRVPRQQSGVKLLTN
jgi:hypothetical protein